RQHDQPGYDECGVADSLDFRDARADRGAEHDEVQRRGDHGRQHALYECTEPACQLESVDRTHGVSVHGAWVRRSEACAGSALGAVRRAVPLTRLTKISSLELSSVRKSLKSMPISLSWRRRLAIPVVSSCVSSV